VISFEFLNLGESQKFEDHGYLVIRFSRFVRFSPSLTNWEIFFDLNEPNLDFFKKFFLTAFQGQKSPYHITRM
jgi:hypothetical protein